MKAKLFNKVLSVVLCAIMIVSLTVCITGVPIKAQSEKMLVWDNVRMYSRLHYRPNTGNFEAGAKYVYSFDFDNLTNTEDDNLWRIYYRNAEEESKDTFIQIPYAALSITKTELANGFHYDVVFTVPDDCYETDNIMFKYGDVTSNGYIQNMRMGNLDLWKLDANGNKETQIELSLPDSIGGIPVVKTDNPIKFYGYAGKWMGIYNYMTDISLQDQDGYFTPEVLNPFSAPENILRIYKGAKNVYAEYVDSSVNLPAGDYVFGCKYKTFGTTPDFEILFSFDNGASYTQVDTEVFDSKKNNRSVKFTLDKNANAIKIVVGSLGDRTDVSLAVAGAFLTRSDDEKQLISDLGSSTVNFIGLNDANTEKTWNVHTDADNAAAVELLAYDASYFAVGSKTMTYQNVAGKQFSRIVYKNSSIVFEKNVEYMITANFKVLSGKFDPDDVSNTNYTDPAFRAKVANYYLENAKANYFNVLDSHFDELTGKLYIRFSSKTKRTGLEITAGNYSTESTEGVCAIGNVSVCECFTKPDGVAVCKDNLIDDITEGSLCTVKNGDGLQENKWNVVYVSSSKEYKLTDYSADYFKASPAMIEIKEDAKGAQIAYNDSSLTLSAGKIYRFTMNMRTVSGNPKLSLAAKNIGDTAGASYSAIAEDANFLSYYNEEYEKNTYLKTITFTPNKDVSDIRILIGNMDVSSSCGLIVANAQLYNVDTNGITVGADLLAEMVNPKIKRNSAEQKIWDLNADDKQIEVTVPVKDNLFKLEKMIRIEPNNSYNRIEYYDEGFELISNATYRFTADLIVNGGNPDFSLDVYDNNPNSNTYRSYISIRNIATQYNVFADKENNIRCIEFKVKSFTGEELANIGDLRFVFGNTGEAKDISADFANPQFYVIENGNPVGENLITPITDDTVLYMTSERNYEGKWDLRYQGAKGVAVKLLEIPDNHFRTPVLAVKGGSGAIAQNVTVKPNTNYKLSYYVKAAAGKSDPYIKAVLANGDLADVTVSNELTNENGYYSYSCEFKTPASLKESNNLRVGLAYTNTFDGIAGNFQLYELNSGFETTGANLISNGNFTESADIAEYTDPDSAGWTFEGTLGDSGVTARASGCFIIPVSKMFIFVAGSTDNCITQTATLVPGNSYELSFNLKYANPGYEGETGVVLTYKKGNDLIALDAVDNSPANEYKKCYSFTLPADASATDNFTLKILAGSEYVSGYLANAVLCDTSDKQNNLFVNGNFSEGTIGWTITKSFRSTYFTEIPDGYFDNPETHTPGMMVYRCASSWENFEQTFLNLKSDSYYLLKAVSVHPWEPLETSVYSLQLAGTDEDGKAFSNFISAQPRRKCSVCGDFVTFTEHQHKNEDGEVEFTDYTCDVCGNLYNETVFNKLPAKSNAANDKNVIERIYHTPKNLSKNGNTHFRIVMQGGGNAGYWGDIAFYECDEFGNILSNSVIINGDFSLGITGWNHTSTEKFVYRFVEQPDGFFDTYSKNAEKMIVSNGTENNAVLGQTVNVERGKKYYFSGFYVNMNSAGIEPKIYYVNTNGETVEAPMTVASDSDRFFFECEFTLPDDAKSVRGSATADFVITNGAGGRAYFYGLAVYEEGKYENLYKNADFKSGFTGWKTSSNYTIAKFDESVFVFYNDDKKFDDGDWSGTVSNAVIRGSITGSIVDDTGSPLKGIKVTINPGGRVTRTDASGIYKFSNLLPGTYSLYVEMLDGVSMLVREVTVESGMLSGVSQITITFVENEPVTVDLDEEANYGIVCGYFYDGNGKPLKGKRLYLGNIASVVTKDKGVFQFNNVPPGEYDIYTKLSDGSIRILKRVVVVAGKGKIYRLRMPASNTFPVWLIVVIAAGGFIVLNGIVATVLFFVIRAKRKRKKMAANKA